MYGLSLILCLNTACRKPALEVPASPSPTLSPATPVFVEEDPKDWEKDLELEQAPEFTEDFISKGKVLYSRDCATCHYSFDGSPPPNSLDAGPQVVDFFKEGFKYGSKPEQIYAVTFFGIEGTGKAPFGDVYTPEEIWSVVAAIEKHLDEKHRNSEPRLKPKLAP